MSTNAPADQARQNVILFPMPGAAIERERIDQATQDLFAAARAVTLLCDSARERMGLPLLGARS
jgi:hypothetical protein